MPHLRLAACIAVAAATVLAAAGAAARTGSPDEPGRWPSGLIRVYDASGWHRAAGLALAQWNAARLGVRFVQVGRRADADVVIVTDAERAGRTCGEACEAFVTRIGYGGEDVLPSEVVLPEPSPTGWRRPSVEDVQLLVHELGHVLGLRHREDECKVMNPELAQACRPALSGDGEWLCGPLPRDLRKAAALYRVRPAHMDPYCLT